MKALEQQTKIDHFYWLDLIRFIAALFVVIAHIRGVVFVEYGALEETEKTLLVAMAYGITRIGHEAVIIFFVLSGFLVGGRALDRIARGQFKPVEYAVDRFIRIMLPLLPALILTAIVNIIINGNFSVVDFIGNLLSLQGIFVPPFGGNGPLWSLAYEVWFYILIYAIGIASIKKYLHFPSFILLVVVSTIFTSLNVIYFFCWLIGMFAYIRRPRCFSLSTLLLSIILCLYSIVAIQIGSDSVSISIDSIRIYLPSTDISIITLAAGMALITQQLLFMEPSSIFMRKLNHIGTILAASSYSLYLTHYPILTLFSHLGWGGIKTVTLVNIAVLVALIIICLLTGLVMYLLFEKHTGVVRNLVKNKYYKYREI